MVKNYVWLSSDESIENKQLSILACVEIVWSVTLYWLIWYLYETHWHLISSLIAAPFLLLRSPESIKKGIEWHNHSFEHIPLKSGLGILLVLGIVTVTFAACWGLASSWLPEYEGFALYWRAAVIGGLTAGVIYTLTNIYIIAATIGIAAVVATVAVAPAAVFMTVPVALVGVITGIGAIVVIVAITIGFAFSAKAISTNSVKKSQKMVFFLSSSLIVALPVFSIIYWLRTVALRLLATLRFLPAGARCFADNWNENMFYVDPCHAPTLLPGDESLSGRRFLGDLSDENNLKKIT